MGLLKSLKSRVGKDDWVEQMLTEPAGVVWCPPKIWEFAVRQIYFIPGTKNGFRNDCPMNE